MSAFGAAFGTMLNAAASAAANTIKKKKPSSGSSQSTGGNKGSSSGGSHSYGNVTNAGDGTISQADYNRYAQTAQNAANNWKLESDPARKEYWHQVAVEANTKLGKSYDDHTGTWSGGYTVEQPYDKSFAESVGSGYDEAEARAQAARDAAINSGVSSLQQQIPGINQNYDEAARQAYINYMQAQKQLPGQLSAVGVSGQGAAESTMAQQQNAYQNTLSNTELARQKALAANQDAQQNVRLTADLKYADNAANIALQQAQAAQAYLAQQLAALDSQKNYLLNYGSLTGSMGGVPTLGYQQYQSDNAYRDKQFDQSQQAMDYDQQMAMKSYYMNLWQGMGTRGATPEIAQMLGIPVGSVYGQGTYNGNYY